MAGTVRSRARSKSRGAGARAASGAAESESSAPVRTSRRQPRGRSRTRKKNDEDGEEDDDDNEEEEQEEPQEDEENEDGGNEDEDDEDDEDEAEDAATKKDSVAKGTVEDVDDTLWGTKVAGRLIYTQLLILGVFALAVPDQVATKLYRAPDANGALTFMPWFGIFVLQLAFMVIAAVQGSHADQKKSLQYLMFLPIMELMLVMSQVDVLHQEALNVITGAALLNEGLMIWACYYSEGPAELEDVAEE